MCSVPALPIVYVSAIILYSLRSFRDSENSGVIVKYAFIKLI